MGCDCCEYGIKYSCDYDSCTADKKTKVKNGCYSPKGSNYTPPKKKRKKKINTNHKNNERKIH